MKNFFSFASKELYHKYICVKFHKKNTVLKKERNICKVDPKIPQSGRQQRGTRYNFFNVLIVRVLQRLYKT